MKLYSWQVIEESQFHMHFIDVRKEENPEEAAKVWMKNDLSMPVDLKKILYLLKHLFKLKIIVSFGISASITL